MGREYDRKFLESLGENMGAVVRDYVAKEKRELKAEIASLRERVAFLEGKAGRDLSEGSEPVMRWTPSTARQ